MTDLLIRIGVGLFSVCIAGAVLGIALAMLFAPVAENDEQEQDDERSQRRRC